MSSGDACDNGRFDCKSIWSQEYVATPILLNAIGDENQDGEISKDEIADLIRKDEMYPDFEPSDGPIGPITLSIRLGALANFFLTYNIITI